MKSALRVAACAAFLTSSASAALVLDILYVAGNGAATNSADYQTFATSGQFAGSTWTAKGSGLTADETVGGNLDRTGIFGGASQTLKSYIESFDLVIVGLPVTSGNFVDDVGGADWAGLDVPIMFNSALAGRAVGGRVGLTSGDNATTTYVFDNANETTKVSVSPIGNAIFQGTTNPNNLYSALNGDIIRTVSTIGGGETISTVTNGASTAYSIIYWEAGEQDANLRVLAENRAVFALKAGITDLSADGRIVLGNLINQLAIPEPSTALFGATASLVTVLFRRRRD